MIGDSEGNFFPTEFDFASGLASVQFNQLSADAGISDISPDVGADPVGMARSSNGLPSADDALATNPIIAQKYNLPNAIRTFDNIDVGEEIDLTGRAIRTNMSLGDQYDRIEGNPTGRWYSNIEDVLRSNNTSWGDFIGKNPRLSDNIDDSREEDMVSYPPGADLPVLKKGTTTRDKIPLRFSDEIGNLINQEDFYHRAFEGQQSLPVEAFQSVMGSNFDWDTWVRDQRLSTNVEDLRPTAFDTPLPKQEEERFQEWKQKYAPDDSGEDYDLRGAFKAGLKPDPESGHFPDTFKKPNHPTFSDQSIYSKLFPELAGKWDGDTFIPPEKPAVTTEAQPFKANYDKSKPLNDRSVFNDEIEKNPALIKRMATMVKGEVGLGRDPVKERIQLISALQRARIRGISLSESLRAVNEGRGGYYARDTYRRAPSAKEMEHFMNNVYKPVMAGAQDDIDVLGFPVTGNASLMSFAGKRLAQGLYANGKWYSGKPGVGEMFVTEKPDAIRLAKLGIPIGTAVASNSKIPLPRERPDVHLAEVAPETLQKHDVAEVSKSMDAIRNMISGGANVPVQAEEIKNAADSVIKFLQGVSSEIGQGFGKPPDSVAKTRVADNKTGRSGTTAEKYLSNKDQHSMSSKDIEDVAKYLISKGLDPSKILGK